MKTADLAEIVDGTLEGSGDIEISGIAPLDRAGPGDLSFLASASYLTYVDQTAADALLIARDLQSETSRTGARIFVADVHRALAELLPHLYPEPEVRTGIHPTAVLEPGVTLGEDVTLGPYSVVGSRVRLGDRVRIGPHAVVESECDLDDDVVLHSHVVLYRGVRIGQRSVLHAGVRAGVDGFGYAEDEGEHRKIPQVGRCLIGADVEIGANSTIDRGSVGATEIGDGVKIDNLVHIGHNVRIGEGSIIIAQVGIAGSVRVGKGVTLAGQAGIPGHVEIGDGATVAAQAGLFGDVPAGAVYSGYPARPHREALRTQAALQQLPEALKRLRAIERSLSNS